MNFQKYRKKPINVGAIKFSKELWDKEISENNKSETYPMVKLDLIKWANVIETLEGNMVVSDGDYIIKGLQGEFYPCKPDIFEATYDIVLS